MIRFALARIFYMWGSLHRNFGNKSSFAREHRSAIKRFGQAYNLDPNFRKARLDRAILLYREMGLYEEAMEDLDALLTEDPAFEPALLNRAMIEQEMGLYSSALADLEAYLALPVEDEEYRRIAIRTADLLREVVGEMDDVKHNGLESRS